MISSAWQGGCSSLRKIGLLLAFIYNKDCQSSNLTLHQNSQSEGSYCFLRYKSIALRSFSSLSYYRVKNGTSSFLYFTQISFSNIRRRLVQKQSLKLKYSTSRNFLAIPGLNMRSWATFLAFFSDPIIEWKWLVNIYRIKRQFEWSLRSDMNFST